MVVFGLIEVIKLFFYKKEICLKRDARKKIDPKDYTIDGKVGETIFKMPGSVKGMQFIIQNLEVPI